MFHRPLGCTAAAVLPKQDSGTSQIKVNPTQVREEMGHPVLDEYYIGWTESKQRPLLHFPGRLYQSNHDAVKTKRKLPAKQPNHPQCAVFVLTEIWFFLLFIYVKHGLPVQGMDQCSGQSYYYLLHITKCSISVEGSATSNNRGHFIYSRLRCRVVTM